MNTVEYKNKKYPVRILNVDRGLGEETITIAPQSLSDAMGSDVDIHGSAAQRLDEEIYFYLPDEWMNNPAEYICKDLLDEPVDFVSEEDNGSIEECEELEDLIDVVIDQMKDDIRNGDTTAIAEVLRYIPKENLIAYLPDEKQKEFNT